MSQKQGIPFEQFKLFCTTGYKYTGDVEDFGYVYWVTESVPLTLPDDFPIILPNHAKTTYITVSKLKVIPYAKPPLFIPGENTDIQQKEREAYKKFQKFLTTLLTTVNTINSSYGVVKTYQSMSTTAVTLGPKYITINKQGTLVRNTKRVYTTKGKLASKAGRKLFAIGLVIDAALVLNEKETVQDAAINTTINAGILIIGEFCPPLGVILGAAYLMYSFGSRPEGYTMSYEEVHGIAPADNTRVHNPYKR